MSGYNIFMIGYRAKLGLAPKESRDVSQLRTVADHLFLQAFSLLAQNQRFVPLSFTMKEDTHRNHWFQESYDSLSNIHSRREIGDLIETACFIGPGDTSTDSIPKAHRIKNNHVIEFRKLISEGIRQFGCHSEKGKPALLCPAQYPRSFSHRQFISGNVLGLDGNIDFEKLDASYSEQVRSVKSPLDYYAGKFAKKLDSINHEMLAGKPIELSFDGNYRNSHVFYRGLSLSEERSPAPIPTVFHSRKPIGFIPIHAEILDALRALGKMNVERNESRVIHVRLSEGDCYSIQRPENQTIPCLVTIPLAWIQDEGFWHKRRVYTGNDLGLNPSLGPEHIESTMQSTLDVVKRTTEVFREAIEG